MVIYVPVGLKLDQLLEKNGLGKLCKKSHRDNLLKFLSIVIETNARRNMKPAPIHSEFLSIYFGSKVKFYRDVLIKLGLICCDEHYIQRKKCFYYLVNPSWNKSFKKVEYKSRFDRIVVNKKVLAIPKEGINLHLFNFLKEIEIDESKLPFFDNSYQKVCIDNIKNKNFLLTEDSFGRIHSNLTNLKSSFRKSLVYKSSSLINIDIANSQPLLIYLLYKQAPSLPIPTVRTSESEDRQDSLYKSLCEKGELYDYLSQHWNLNKKSVKKQLFKEVLFGRGICPKFQSMFQNISYFILYNKSEDFRALAYACQRLESDIIIRGVCKNLMTHDKTIPLFTIHDSILTTPPYVGAIKEFIFQEFEKHNLRPTLTVS